MTTGIHHVTAITRDVQQNVDFYAGFLGLRLVKRTGGYEDAEQLHLFYGDRLGSPGSLVTFLVWQAGAAGRVGLGQVSEIAFAVAPSSIGDWLQRALAAGVPFTGPSRELGETVLRLKDPDGIIVKLVGTDMPAAAPLPDPIAPTRIRSVTILTEDADSVAGFARRFGYREQLRDGPFIRMASASDVIDLRQSAGYVPGVPGTGVFDHVAFRAPDVDAVRRMRLDLRDHDGITNVHDRKYFLSLYVREPTGTLFEYATDEPGFTVDENADRLGEALMIPPGETARSADLRVMMPQFAMPGEGRMPVRDLPFVHRFHVPEDPDGSVLVLLHGTGGNEADLMPLGHRIDPRATLLGVRGRSTEEGIFRWFRRLGGERFDQNDIRSEAEAFEAFVSGAVSGYGLDAARLVFLGYSNGANFLGAVMRLRPGVVDRAMLLRATDVLEDGPKVELPDTRVLVIAGADDPYSEGSGRLEQALREAGASITAAVVDAGHELATQDEAVARDWLASNSIGLQQAGEVDLSVHGSILEWRAEPPAFEIQEGQLSDIVITKEDGARRGRYVARIEGIDGEGEITFTHPREGVISANHTGVPDSMGGRGVARALLDFMLDDARTSGFRIVPICPYVRAQYAKHPEWSDLFTTRPGENP